MSSHWTRIWPNGPWLSACNPLLGLAGHGRIVVTVARALRDVPAGFRMPFGRPYQARLDQVQAAYQPQHLGPAADVHARRRRVVDPGRVVDLRSVVRGAMGEREVAAGRERGQQLA